MKIKFIKEKFFILLKVLLKSQLVMLKENKFESFFFGLEIFMYKTQLLTTTKKKFYFTTHIFLV